MNLKYKKILLKLSGEFLSDKNEIISSNLLNYIYSEIKSIKKYKTQIGIVIGGGNIIRGDILRQKEKFNNFTFSQTEADKAGMLATIINGILLADFFNKKEMKTKIMSNIFVDSIEFFDASKAKSYLNEDYILIFTGGTSNPYVSTDTASVIKALEIESEVVLKATKVDGIYDKDPKKFSDAKKFESLTFMEALEKRLKIMDFSAFSLAMEKNIPVIVFNFFKKGNLEKIVKGEKIGTIITG